MIIIYDYYWYKTIDMTIDITIDMTISMYNQ